MNYMKKKITIIAIIVLVMVSSVLLFAANNAAGTGEITIDEIHRGLYLLDFLDFITQEQYDIAMDYINTEFPGLRYTDFGTHDVIMSYIIHIKQSLGWEGASEHVMAYDILPFDENVTDPMRILVKMMEVVYLDFFETSYLARGYMPGGEASRSHTLFRRPLVLN